MSQLVERSTIKHKAQKVEKIVNLINKYNVLAFASLNKVRALQLQELAKRFRSDILMKVTKKILVKRALEESQKKNARELVKHMIGSNILLFTKMSPFTLSILLEKNKIKTTAKAGDIPLEDIVIPAGNTGLPPGPAISELNDAGIRTRIEAGSVWVSRKTIVANKGEPIQPKIASVLSKLGVKPIEVGLKVIAAYEDGLIFTSEQLTPKIDEIQSQFEEAYRQAYNLSVNSLYPTPQTIVNILQRARLRAKNLAINSTYPASEVTAEILSRAYHHMSRLSFKLVKINKEAAPKGFN